MSLANRMWAEVMRVGVRSYCVRVSPKSNNSVFMRSKRTQRRWTYKGGDRVRIPLQIKESQRLLQPFAARRQAWDSSLNASRSN